MSVLSDNEIRGLIKDGILKIDPFDERLVSPASYDLRVGKKALRTTKDRGSPIVDVEKEQLVEINSG